ncbi:acyl carrier protein (plasmid) [Actinacidiphila glaucinigra]|uniref:acyl carrier protein n=1 Tax=Actinacidiphila glaucinigra TaxID=235986 RepID=UPI002DD9BA74|nr:acyl carrier protein [Actinacidiphila glaucinigra]WSD65817.1 acyl carrier protein [Actinacidiphila glaucinigra]
MDRTEPRQDPPIDDLAWLLDACAAITDQPVDVNANLFEQGLTSLGVVRLAGAIQRRHGMRLGAVDLLDHPTVTQLSAMIASRKEPGV